MCKCSGHSFTTLNIKLLCMGYIVQLNNIDIVNCDENYGKNVSFFLYSSKIIIIESSIKKSFGKFNYGSSYKNLGVKSLA
jgi:hypothetical protein